MDDEIDRAAKLAREKHPKRNATPIQYGTAGFRTKSSLLDYVLFRMGMLAVLRSKHKAGATIGLMITASHNPEEDNGVKLIDPMGEMLERAWELYATQLTSVSDDDLNSVLRSIIDQMSIKTEVEVKVVIARDTRPSSLCLSLAAQDGIQVLGGQVVDYGLLTTPQLHYIVRCINTRGAYGEQTETGYYTKLAAAFLKLRGGDGSHGSYHPTVIVDGANGVGASKLQNIVPYLNGMLGIETCNDGSSGKLNHMCGADFVKVQQKAPEGMKIEPNARCASFDGDGDRIVFFYQNQSGKFFLVDGDKIATLVAGYLKELVSQSALELKFGLVQTAYANGSSTDYINNKLNVHVACAPTGVKYLHHEAMNFDIGVYFEANGHGTVLFSDAATRKIQAAAANQNLLPEQKMSAARLSTVVDLINQTVGDAISDLLLVETILHARGWSIADWNSTYTELPNRQVKVKVADRNVIQTTDAERKVTTPGGLQGIIDAIVSKYPHGRSFVRPSGTEDVVRVYSEAETQAAADELAYEVSVAVFHQAGGIGDPPQPVAL